MSKIKAQLNGINLFKNKKEDWDKMSDFLINNLSPSELVFNPLINDLKVY